MGSIIINNKLFSVEIVNEIIKDIKKKKELSNVDSEFVRQEVVKYLRQSRRALNVITTHRRLKSAAEYKKLIKHVRRILRRVYGAFQTEDAKHRKPLLTELNNCIKKGEKCLQQHNEILKTHSSTRERLEIYPKLYKKIFRITGKPKKILDLACGLNPVSFPYIGLKKVSYFATELSTDDCNFIRKYFKIMRITGDVKVINLLKTEELKSLPKADVCFLFKTLETVELTKSHKISEEIIKAIPAKWVIASFPTRTVTGKRMRFPRRGWIERMLKRLGYDFTKLIEENEIFYIIKKLHRV